MNERQKRFCDEYLIDCNATQAAIRAGYSAKTAYSLGQRLLKHAEVKKYIEEHLKKIHNDSIAEATEILEYLTRGMRQELTEDIILMDGEKISKGISLKESIKCAELLGKRYSLFKETINVDGAVPVIVVDDVEEDS